MTLLNLALIDVITLSIICFAAGMVRGFSGFALSAVVMASGALIIPPVQLIPICLCLELTASVLMVRGGWKDANRKVAISLAIGSALGVPVGLAFTTSVNIETSQMAALFLVVVLAVLQLAKVRMAFLATAPGLYGSGLLAGTATGIADVGGMVVALYVLARQAPAREMRGSLVLFLCLGIITSSITYVLYGLLDQTSAIRGAALSIPTAFGVIAGKLLFRLAWEPYYKPFCLCLLIALSGWGIMRLGLGI